MLARTVERVRELARTGRHDDAIEAATRALAVAGLPPATQLDLLDLRAESHIARGEIARAAEDAATMRRTAAAASKDPRRTALAAQAYAREALVQMRNGRFREAGRAAAAALKAARAADDLPLVAHCHFRLAEAQFRESLHAQAIKQAMLAIAQFRQL
ncbi:MAG: hypothetical protein ABI440_05140, partial [Casimicrobiaceae bacterium]